MLASNLEVYVVEVYKATQNGEEITCSDLAKRLGLPIRTAIQSVQRIHYQKYLNYTTYQPIKITPKGEKLAKYIISKDLLIDSFLDILQINQNSELEKETMAQCLNHDMLERIEQFVLFVNQHPEIINRYKLYLEHQQKNRILEPVPVEDR